VAIDAGLHAGGDFLRQDVTLRYGTMTAHTLHLRLVMAGMAEENKIRKMVNPHPFDRDAAFLGCRQLLDRRSIRFNRGVAEHALACLGEPGLVGGSRPHMALYAI